MKYALAPVTALLIGVAILMTGAGLQGTLLPVRASLEEFSTFAIGLIGAAYFLGFTLGCLKGGELVKNVGHVRVFLAMTALGSAAPLIHGLVLDPVVWSFLRFLTGFCIAVLFVVIESWLNERSTNEDRGLVFSTYVMITLTMLAAGQMMTLTYAPSGLELFVISSVLVSLAAIPVALSQSETPEQPTDVEVDLRRLFEISPSGTVGCLATGLANGAFWSLAPVFTSGVSTNASLAAWFMTATVIGGALAQWPMGFVSDRFGRRRTLLLLAATGGATAVIIVASVNNLGFVGINLLGAAWGFFAFPMYAISVAHANDYAEPSEYILVSSGLLLVYGIGAILGPFAASAVMALTGPTGLYVMAGMAQAMLALYLLHRMFRRTSKPSEQHIPFSDALATTYSASQIYEEEMVHQAEEEAAPAA